LACKKHFDTSGKSPALLQHCASFHRAWPCPNELSGAIRPKIPTIEVVAARTGNHRLRVAEQRALAMRVPEEIST
jgi:hypothetical protein